jgi:2,4-dienoyl-CoA reductase-like NADH-dependent reductase (Old Yellow Enzyme family)
MAGHERFRFKSPEAFLDKIHELGLDIPFSQDIDILFEKIRIAGKTLPNRLAAHPMEGADAEAGGAPGELTFRKYRRIAGGGSGLIWFEATAVTEDGKSKERQLWLSKSSLDEFKKLVEKTRTAARGSTGLNRDPLLILQLIHSGRFSRRSGIPAPVIVHHSPILDPMQKIPGDSRLVRDEDLDGIQEAFISAARLAAEAGFDGVDIKACHGYLVSELLAAHTRPDSKYGGPFENRSRFLVETVRTIRTLLPEMIVTSRLSAYDAVPFPHGFGVDKDDCQKEDLDEPKALIQKLAEIGIPLINISIGIPSHSPHFGRPFDMPVPGASIPDEHPLIGIDRLLRITGRLQQSFPSLPVVGTGYSWLRHFFPNAAAAVIKAGNASIIGVGRESLAYPDFVRELAENGGLDSKKVCITCSGCSRLLRSGGPVGCIVRDKSVYRIG